VLGLDGLKLAIYIDSRKKSISDVNKCSEVIVLFFFQAFKEAHTTRTLKASQ